MVEWLNTAFSGFDGGIFSAFNSINSGFLNTFAKYFSYLAEKGIPLILVGVILACFAKTRKVGVGIVLAILIGALFTNVILKNLVERPRPFLSGYQDYWVQAGGVLEDEWSFPSGHSTASMAFALALFLGVNKKYSWLAFVFALVMGISRIYLVVHYPTDVLAGFIVGSVGAVISYFVTRYAFKKFEENKDKKFCKFVLEFSVEKLFTKESKSK